MTAVADALRTLRGVDDLLLEGKTLRADVAQVLTDATVEHTIEGASTLTLALHDSDRKVLRSGLFSSRVTAQVDQFSFELVQVRKAGPNITSVFEDLAVAALRRHNEPRKVAPNTVSHVEFARALVSEEPWIKFRPPQKLPPEPKAKVEMSRGTPAEGEQEEEREDTWTAIGRLADERGWRRFIREGQLWYMPEPYLFARPVSYVVREYQLEGVDEIDFDFDIGKPLAEATLTARAGRWQVPVGSVVELQGVGPADGRWMVKAISRSLFQLNMSITLTKPRPVLPEPEPPPAPSSEELGPDEGNSAPASGGTTKVDVRITPGAGGEGTPARPGATSDKGYKWPVRGRVSSGFGMRNGRLHAGIDIAVPVGTRVAPTRTGTCIFAGTAGGYGYAVYIDHGGVISRYAHLSKIMARRGQWVSVDDVIALSGGARGARGSGNSQGPHLHFEIRPGDKPTNPLRYLP